MTNIANKARRALIKCGKSLPFVLCFIVLISYFESLIALSTHDYLLYGDYMVLNTPLSFAIASFAQYDLLYIIVLVIVSFAIEACYYNRISLLFLLFNIYERAYFTNHVYENNIYYIVAIINALICAFFCYKGIKILRK